MTNESVLKLTNYPFAYSFVGLLMGHFGLKLFETQNLVVFVAAAGFLGTFLATVEPFERLVQTGLLRIESKNLGDDKDVVEKYWESAAHIRGINMEIKKIVGFLYFLISISIFSVSLHYDSFTEQFLFQNSIGEVVCDKQCVTILGSVISVSTLLILGLEAGIRITKLNQYTTVAVWYLCGIDSPYATDSTRESLNNSIERQDWKTAEYWKKRMQEDIQYKRGQREIIIKGIEKVYRPLYKESLVIEDRCNQISIGNSYPYFQIAEWPKIQLESNYIYLEDGELLHQISQFYGIIQDYSHQLDVCSKMVNATILQRASEEFDKKIQRIEYFTDRGGGDGQFRLMDCAILQIHPKDKYQGMPAYADLNFINDTGNSQNYKTPIDELKKFDVMWEKVLVDVENNELVRKMKELFYLIQNQNQELKQKYFDKISEEVHL